MVFSSLMFMCIFLPIVLIAYNLSKNLTYKNTVLIIASLFFYAWGEPIWVVLLIFSAFVDYINGRIIDKYYARAGATIALVSSLVINLGLLAMFKYSGFFIENINTFLHTSIPNPNFKLPIGISFYTFQTLSYTIDMYRGKTRVQKSFLGFLAYVSMFPQLVAGPIVRYSTVASSWLGIIMYTFQIYFDFSGYSDMAIGLGRMLGFHFGENFEYPYISRSITEFWRRWHISLSTFFRDYVYIPLGGNRYHAIRNIFIVWLLTGLWHGASWNFIFWGLFYGVLLFIEKTLFKKKLQKIPAPICYIYTMFFVILGWALFYFTDLNALWTFIKSAFGVGTALYDLTAVSTFCTNAWLIAVCVIASTPIPTIIHKNFCKKSKVFAAISEPVLVIVGLGVCFVLLVGQTYNPFLYFRF